MAIERIVTGENLNNFMINFQSTKSTEELQKLSGMEGKYTNEYQAHFINLVGTLFAGEQKLMFAIPMCFYNYHQEVSGAAIEFNLGEVGEANNVAMKTAVEKFNEFETTDMYKALVEYGITDWQLVGLNSLHCHPSGVNGFSGTDYRADIKHPGVCYPLSVGKNIPNIAMMMQHRQMYAELILAEYTNFNGVEKGERVYEKGRCLTINRGVASIPIPDPEPIPDGAIDLIFGTKQVQPPKPLPAKDRQNFALASNFKDGNIEKMSAFKTEMMNLWAACEFETDMSNVLKTNVTRGAGRLQRQSWYGNTTGKKQGGTERKIKGINEGLFGDDWYAGSEYDLPNNTDLKEPTYSEMLAFLVKRGYSKSDLNLNYSRSDITDEYWEIRIDEYDGPEDDIEEWKPRKTYEQDDKCKYEGTIYTMTGVSGGIISVTAPSIAVGIWTKDEEEDDFTIKGFSDSEMEDLRMIEDLLKMNIMSKEKLIMLSSEDLTILHDEIF